MGEINNHKSYISLVKGGLILIFMVCIFLFCLFLINTVPKLIKYVIGV